VTSAPVWVVDVGVGRLNQLLRPFSPSDKTWCCGRCRAAAQAADHILGAKHAGHYSPALQQQDTISYATPQVIERRG
jgi:hypothetical protein